MMYSFFHLKDGRKRLIMALISVSLLTLTCNDALAWGSVRTNNVDILRNMIGPSHDYILKEAFANLQHDPAYSKEAFPILGNAMIEDPLGKTILSNEGQYIDAYGNPTGLGPDSSTQHTEYSWHEYNPRTGEGKAPEQAANWFNELKVDIEGNRMDSAAKDAAYLAHYIADVTCPFHVNGMPKTEADKLSRTGELSLSSDIVGAPLPVSKIGMGRTQTPPSNERLVNVLPLGGAVRGTGGNGKPYEEKLNTNWSREYNVWRDLPKSNDWFDPWYNDGTSVYIYKIAGIYNYKTVPLYEASSTHALWEWYAYNNYSRPTYDVTKVKVGYSEEFLKIQKNNGNGDKSNIAEFAKEIASNTKDNQQAILDESTKFDTMRDIHSELGKAYQKAISDVCTVWRASFSALRPDIEVGDNSGQHSKKLRVKIKNIAPKTEMGDNTARDIKINIEHLNEGCIQLSYNVKDYPKEIKPGEEITIDDVWELKSDKDCSENAEFQVSVTGKFEGIPDSGRAIINKILSVEIKSEEPLQLAVPAIGQDSSQSPPEGYDKGTWVLTKTALQNWLAQPWDGTYPMYSQPYRTNKWDLQMSENSHTGTTAIAGPKGPDAGYPTATSYTVSWSKLPSSLIPGTKGEIKIDISVSGDKPDWLQGSKAACNVYRFTPNGDPNGERGVENSYTELDWPAGSTPVPAPVSQIAKLDVPWGKNGDVITIKVKPFFGFDCPMVAYDYTYQGQYQPQTKKGVDHITINPINPRTDLGLGEAQVYTTLVGGYEDKRDLRVIVWGQGGYEVPDGTPVKFDLSDLTGIADAKMEPTEAYTKNSEATVTFHPPSEEYWKSHDPSAPTTENRMTITATSKGKEDTLIKDTYILYMVRPAGTYEQPTKEYMEHMQKLYGKPTG